MIPSIMKSSATASSRKKVWATGPGSARPVVSITTRSKLISAALRLFARRVRAVTRSPADGAADASVAHLDDLLGIVLDKNVAVDIFFPEFVFDDRDALFVLLIPEYPVQKSGLAGAEKPVMMVTGISDMVPDMDSGLTFRILSNNIRNIHQVRKVWKRIPHCCTDTIHNTFLFCVFRRTILYCKRLYKSSTLMQIVKNTCYMGCIGCFWRHHLYAGCPF